MSLCLRAYGMIVNGKDSDKKEKGKEEHFHVHLQKPSLAEDVTAKKD